jgi:hypothetical protein
MAVELDLERDAFSVTWITENVGGPDDLVDIKATNPDSTAADLGLSTKNGHANNGNSAWTIPKGYSGTVDFEVSGPEGVETGTVSV